MPNGFTQLLNPFISYRHFLSAGFDAFVFLLFVFYYTSMPFTAIEAYIHEHAYIYILHIVSAFFWETEVQNTLMAPAYLKRFEHFEDLYR